MRRLVLISFVVCFSSYANPGYLETFRVSGLSSEPLVRGEAFQKECALDANTAAGIRYKCGQSSPYIELLLVNGRKDAGAVLHYRNEEGDKDRKNYLCDLDEAVDNAFCREVPPRIAKNETDFLSPILKSHPSLPIRNSHFVGPQSYEKESTIVRGMAPYLEEEVKALKDFGIQWVLIFKNDVKGDTTTEKERLTELKFDKEKVKQISFPWKNHENFQEPCQQTVEALQFIKKARDVGERLYFHCTVGEDRTGFLAGLYRILTENMDYRDVFREEMCDRGYSWGDPGKPFDHVVRSIEEATTRLYLKMVYLIKIKKLSWDNLSLEACRFNFSNEGAFTRNPEYRLGNFFCKSSPRYRPIPQN